MFSRYALHLLDLLSEVPESSYFQFILALTLLAITYFGIYFFMLGCRRARDTCCSWSCPRSRHQERRPQESSAVTSSRDPRRTYGTAAEESETTDLLAAFDLQEGR